LRRRFRRRKLLLPVKQWLDTPQVTVCGFFIAYSNPLISVPADIRNKLGDKIGGFPQQTSHIVVHPTYGFTDHRAVLFVFSPGSKLFDNVHFIHLLWNTSCMPPDAYFGRALKEFVPYNACLRPLSIENREFSEVDMSVRSQIAAVKKIRDNDVPAGASDDFVEGWKAAFAAIFDDYRIFDLMPKLALPLEVTPEVALKFIERMQGSGYEPVKDKVSSENQSSWYFKINGETCIDYEVIIRQPDGKAFIQVRPR
jgi:hypothetical protein